MQFYTCLYQNSHFEQKMIENKIVKFLIANAC